MAQQIITTNFPGALGSGPNLINNNGEMVGAYWHTAPGVDSHGYTLLNGQYTTVDFPGAVQTIASGINDAGEIVGSYVDGANVTHGFVLDGSTFTTLDFPGSNLTDLTSVNNLGEIVGAYTVSNSPGMHGFSLKSGVFATVDFPGAQINIPNQVNNNGVIAGWYLDSSNLQHGYVYTNGVFKLINVPGSSSTSVNAINDSGQLSGVFSNSAAAFGFTYLNGQFTTVNFPASTGSIENLALNNAGQLAAFYEDPGGDLRGALLTFGPFAYVNSATGINVYDVGTLLLLTSVASTGGTYPTAASPDGTTVYATDFGTDTVSFIDTTSNTVTSTVPVGISPNSACISPNGINLYVSNFNGDSVSVVNTTTRSLTATISLPTTNPVNCVVSPDGKTLYVTHDPQAAVTEISTLTNAVTQTITVNTFPYGIAISPDGKTLYVTSAGSLDFVDTASGAITQSVTIPNEPWEVSVSPDGTKAYVGERGGGAVVVVDTIAKVILASIPVQPTTWSSAPTADGAFVWQANSTGSTTAIIATTSNTVVATIPFGGGGGVIIPFAPPASQSITQPLSPTAPNTFNFGPHNFTVQYPAGTSFSGVNMTVVAAQATQQTFKERVSGTQFANATCIVYSGAGGNCLDYEVTCSSANGGQISCPSEASPTISVKTSFDTQQAILNPGFLTTPIGENVWTNIFESFYLQRIDPTMKGRTRGFSEFVAVDLGASNAQGAGSASFSEPLTSNDERIFPSGSIVPVQFHLTSIAHPGVIVTDAVAGLSVVQTSDSKGNSTANIVLDAPTGFAYSNGAYNYSLKMTGYAAGTYALTIYGNAFAAQQVQFMIPVSTTGAQLTTTLQSLSLNSSATQYVALLKITNTGTAAANGVLATASTLNGVATATALPLGVGDISAGQSATMTVSYPIFAGAQNSRAALTVSLAYAGGSSGVGLRVELP